MIDPTVRSSVRRTIFSVLLVLSVAVLAFFALILPLVERLVSPTPALWQVAQQDILAPTDITYPSQVQTEDQRNQAANQVGSIYTSPNTAVARLQLERLRAALAYINTVRADSYASNVQKLEDLGALEDVRLNAETAANLLALNETRWQIVQQEVILVLEQVMRSTIRSDRLEEARRSVPSAVSLSLPETQAAMVAELAGAFIAPNSVLSETLTAQARQQARENVRDIIVSYKAGQKVISRGQLIRPVDIEALQKLGLTAPQWKWQDPISAGTLVILMLVFCGFALRQNSHLASHPRSLALVSILFLGFLFGARLLIPGRTVIPYAFPLGAYSLIVAVLLGPELAMITSLPLAVMAAYGLPNALDLTLYYTLSSIFGVLVLGRARRVTSFLWAGGALALAGAVVSIIYRLPLPTADWIGLVTLALAALFNGLASASLTIVLQLVLAQFLGTATPMQLVELTRPDQPLLQLILRDAPGTYQHSLQVANLAEQAGEQIGADTLLIRVGALYHDAGKVRNPLYFIENQQPGVHNPHDDLDPVTSAKIILNHVRDGQELIRKYRLPRKIADFVTEHHGTMMTRYQYARAVAAAGGDEAQVDAANFTYSGPRPASRETAILMLADGCEARVRAEHPEDETKLRALIKSVINERMTTGQLDNTDLTLRDLDAILQSFTSTLRSVYHPRLPYPLLESHLVEPAKPLPLPASTASEDRPTIPVGSMPVPEPPPAPQGLS